MVNKTTTKFLPETSIKFKFHNSKQTCAVVCKDEQEYVKINLRGFHIRKSYNGKKELSLSLTIISKLEPLILKDEP